MLKFLCGNRREKNQSASTIPGYLLRDCPEQDGFVMVGDHSYDNNDNVSSWNHHTRAAAMGATVSNVDNQSQFYNQENTPTQPTDVNENTCKLYTRPPSVGSSKVDTMERQWNSVPGVNTDNIDTSEGYADVWKTIPFHISKRYTTGSDGPGDMRVSPLDLSLFQYDFSVERSVLNRR